MKLYLIAILFRLTLYQAVSQGLIVYDCNYDDTGRPLPPGVPREVDINGVTMYVPDNFTTAAYQEAALDKMIQEANRVAKTMKLQETLPITRSNLMTNETRPFGFAYGRGIVGTVSTTHFVYSFESGNKFSSVEVADDASICKSLQKRQWLPVSQIDTNAAYQLATQWLASASMDVAGLNRDCEAQVFVNPYYSGLGYWGDQPTEKFVPIYIIWWVLPHGKIPYNIAASVQLYLPEKKLLRMTVNDPQYILHPPVVFTNLAELFPGVATITTNIPTPPPDYSEAEAPLPPGVPRMVNSKGVTLCIFPFDFTTEAYQQVALDRLIQEANQVAKELKLPETLPITRSNLTGSSVAPFGLAYPHRAIGSVTTTRFEYCVTSGNQLNLVKAVRFEEQARLPLSKIDTNAAYQLATRWLTAASMDVAGLNRDGQVHIKVDAYENEEGDGDEPSERKFVPRYHIWWVPRQGDSRYTLASVELYLPKKQLLDMTVLNSQYNLRPPILITNLAELFPGNGIITTNDRLRTGSFGPLLPD